MIGLLLVIGAVGLFFLIVRAAGNLEPAGRDTNVEPAENAYDALMNRYKAKAETWVSQRLALQDYKGLAGIATTTDDMYLGKYVRDSETRNAMQKAAFSALRRVGSPAVSAIMDELTSARILGAVELAELLVEIGDLRCLSLLEEKLEAGAFSHSSGSWTIRRFVEKHSATAQARNEEASRRAREAEGKGRSAAKLRVTQWGFERTTPAVQSLLDDLSDAGWKTAESGRARGLTVIGRADDPFFARGQEDLPPELEKMTQRIYYLLSDAPGSPDPELSDQAEIRTYGELLHALYGKDGMLLVYGRVEAMGGRKYVLTRIWSGVGEWQM